MDRTDALRETFLESRRKAGRRPAAEAPEEVLAFAFDLTCLCCRLVRSDEVVLSSERRAVEEALTEQTGLDPSFLRSLLDFIFSLEDRELPSPRELVTHLASHPETDRLRLVDGMLAVAAADDQVHRRELALIERFALAAGLSEAAFHELLSERRVTAAMGGLEIPLKGPVSIGRGSDNQIQLPSLSVSTHHARLFPDDGGWAVEDLGSTTGTWIDGRRVSRRPLHSGDVIQIENFRLRVDPRRRKLTFWNQNEFLLLSAEDLGVVVPDRRNGAPRAILDRVSCSFCSGELIAVTGPSGSGKTTLIHALLGEVPTSRGRVLLNGEACRGLLERHGSRLGMVPQEDVVYGQLTVEEALFFAGALRAVPGVSPDEIRAEVDRVLGELGLERVRHARIGDVVERGISGGERKRVNLGLELLNPSTRILFLDEPTTGLDPHRGLETFRLLRHLADQGRLVLVVTHRVDSETLSLVDKIAMVGVNGRLAYFGSPQEMLETCGAGSMAALFEELQKPERSAELARRHESLRPSRPPVESEPSGTVQADDGKRPDASEPRRAEERSPRPWSESFASTLSRWRVAWRQLTVQTTRYARVKWRDPVALVVNFGQVPLIVLGCWLVLHQTLTQPPGGGGGKAVAVIPGALPFILVIAAFWLGCVSSVRELVADQALFRRERRAGLGVLPYLGAKVTVLAGVTVVQSLLLVAFTWPLFRLEVRHLDLGETFTVLTLTGWVGMTLGLCVSALFRSTQAAVATLPVLLIPQLLFGGLLVSLDRMPEPMRWLSLAMASRWGQEAFILSGESGLSPGGVASREDCTLFSIPGGENGGISLCRNAFLGQLGFAHRPDEYAAKVPDGTLARALSGLVLLTVLATLAAALALRRSTRRR